jgi:hypothetical protein
MDKESPMNVFVRSRKQQAHPLIRGLPPMLNTVAILSLARRIGLRRGSRLLELAAAMYLRDRKRRRRSMRRH